FSSSPPVVFSVYCALRCIKASVDCLCKGPWEGVGTYVHHVDRSQCVCVGVCVCFCECVDAWLVSVVCLLWSLLHMGSFSLCISEHIRRLPFFFEVSCQRSLGGVGHRFRCCRGPVESRGVDAVDG